MRTPTIDHENKKIRLPKAFAKASGKYGSEEYRMLMEIKRDVPNYEVIVETTRKKPKDNYKGLTYDYMERYIQKHNSELIEEFKILHGEKEDMNGLFKSRSYSQIKKWFLTNFPEVKNFEKNRTELINKPKEKSETVNEKIEKQEDLKKVA